jgi:ABC-type multidrug transport system fused ATPase/permease subunit
MHILLSSCQQLLSSSQTILRIIKFLDAPELQNGHVKKKYSEKLKQPIIVKSASFSWDQNSVKPTLRNVSLYVEVEQHMAVCGEVSSRKSTLLTAILGEILKMNGMVISFHSTNLRLPPIQLNFLCI